MEEVIWVENYVLWKTALRRVSKSNEVILYVSRVPFWKSWRTAVRNVKTGDGKLLMHQYVGRGI